MCSFLEKLTCRSSVISGEGSTVISGDHLGAARVLGAVNLPQASQAGSRLSGCACTCQGICVSARAASHCTLLSPRAECRIFCSPSLVKGSGRAHGGSGGEHWQKRVMFWPWEGERTAGIFKVNNTGGAPPLQASATAFIPRPMEAQCIIPLPPISSHQDHSLLFPSSATSSSQHLSFQLEEKLENHFKAWRF